MRSALFFVAVLSLAGCKKEAEVEALPDAPVINPANAVSVTVRGATDFTELEVTCKAGGVQGTAPLVDGTAMVDGATSDCWIFLNPGRVSYGPVERGAQLTCFITEDGGLGCK